jgi:predicted Fe-S protein YdhL (DUF1289 family)
LGCFRSLEEILQWSRASDTHKQEFLTLAAERRADHERRYGPPIAKPVGR